MVPSGSALAASAQAGKYAYMASKQGCSCELADTAWWLLLCVCVCVWQAALVGHLQRVLLVWSAAPLRQLSVRARDVLGHHVHQGALREATPAALLACL